MRLRPQQADPTPNFTCQNCKARAVNWHRGRKSYYCNSCNKEVTPLEVKDL